MPVTKLLKLSSAGTNPYGNLALEKYLMDHVGDGEVILYLWQNERTVVCGRNQNLWKECHVSKLLRDGGFPARRLSGGGAVFHDLGNLNFTFLARQESYAVSRQLQVITEACGLLGIPAEITGRNDVAVDGRKFSGNAFYHAEEQRCHHGTILICADKAKMSSYLNVDKAKLTSKGVSSVRSRVANLSEFCPECTVSLMKEKLFEAFESVYSLKPEEISLPESAALELAGHSAFFSSDRWLYGRRIDFTDHIEKRFPWGNFDLSVRIEQGRISVSSLCSDANDEAFIRRIASGLDGCDYSSEALTRLVTECCETEEHFQMAEDIRGLLFASI